MSEVKQGETVKTVTLEGPDGQRHVVQVGSLVYKLMIAHKYKVIKS